MINRSSKPSTKTGYGSGFEGSPGILKKGALKNHNDEFLPQLTSPRAAENTNSSYPMPTG